MNSSQITLLAVLLAPVLAVAQTTAQHRPAPIIDTSVRKAIFLARRHSGADARVRTYAG